MMHFFKKFQSNQKGLTLIEVTILMLVLALFMVPLLNLWEIRVKQRRHDNTTIVMPSDINAALRRYAFLNDRYPAPANPDHSNTNLDLTALLPGTTSFLGIEVDGNTPATLTALPACAPNLGRACRRDVIPATPATAADDILIGALPVRTLGLPDSYITDPMGGQWIYAVSRSMVENGGFFNNFNGTIQIQEYRYDSEQASPTFGTIIPFGLPTTNAHYVITSTGEAGAGAYSMTGVPIAPCGNTGSLWDRYNCDNIIDTTTAGTTGDDFVKIDSKALIPGGNYHDDYTFFVTSRDSEIWAYTATTTDLFNAKQGSLLISPGNTPGVGNNIANPLALTPIAPPIGKVHVMGNILTDDLEVDRLCITNGTLTAPLTDCETGGENFTPEDIVGLATFNTGHEDAPGAGIYCGRLGIGTISDGDEICQDRLNAITTPPVLGLYDRPVEPTLGPTGTASRSSCSFLAAVAGGGVSGGTAGVFLAQAPIGISPGGIPICAPL